MYKIDRRGGGWVWSKNRSLGQTPGKKYNKCLFRLWYGRLNNYVQDKLACGMGG